MSSGLGLKPLGANERGIVISCPMDISGTSLNITTKLDPQELRYSLLFFDRLVWPNNNIVHIASDSDAAFLESAGILTRPDLRFSGSGDGASIVANLHFAAFTELSNTSPGNWALQTGERAFQWEQLASDAPTNAALLSLIRAVPVPEKDVPLAEVLDFKSKRHDLVVALRSHIEGFIPAVAKAENFDEELAIRSKEIERACLDLLAVGMEWKSPVRLADLKAAVKLESFNLGKAIDSVAKWGVGGFAFGFPDVGTLVGSAVAAASMIKIDPSAIKLRPMRPQSTPYEYVYRFHNELF